MSEKKELNELALNRREITHDSWGSFIICRPTSRIQSKIDTAVTRAYNRDLQTKERIPDENAPKGFRDVPAFLTRRSKAALLEEHGEWTEEDRLAGSKAEEAYRKACFELDNAGFVGTQTLIAEFDEIKLAVEKILGKKAEKLSDELNILFPIDTARSDPYERPSVEAFVAARDKVDETAKSIDLLPYLERLTELHKQYVLLLEGTKAQTDLFAVKIKEITLFTDTVESRSEKAGQLVKIMECVLDDEEQRPWQTIIECEESDPDLLAWLLQEIEKFERFDPSDTESEESKYRFNFLFPLGVTSTALDDSHAQRMSNNDGESQQEAPTPSTEDLDIPAEN